MQLVERLAQYALPCVLLLALSSGAAAQAVPEKFMCSAQEPSVLLTLSGPAQRLSVARLRSELASSACIVVGAELRGDDEPAAILTVTVTRDARVGVLLYAKSGASDALFAPASTGDQLHRVVVTLAAALLDRQGEALASSSAVRMSPAPAPGESGCVDKHALAWVGAAQVLTRRKLELGFGEF